MRQVYEDIHVLQQHLADLERYSANLVEELDAFERSGEFPGSANHHNHVTHDSHHVSAHYTHHAHHSHHLHHAHDAHDTHHAHMTKGAALLHELEEQLHQQLHHEQHRVHEAYHQAAERLRGIAQEMDELEQMIDDLQSLVAICEEDGIVGDERIHEALNNLGSQLEFHGMLPVRLPALLDHHAKRANEGHPTGPHNEHPNRVQIGIDILKLFGHAADGLERDRSLVESLMHENHAELHALIGMLPADVQRALA
jgi:hypothetical protein